MTWVFTTWVCAAPLISRIEEGVFSFFHIYYNCSALHYRLTRFVGAFLKYVVPDSSLGVIAFALFAG